MEKVKVLRSCRLVVYIKDKKYTRDCVRGEVVDIDQVYDKDITDGMYVRYNTICNANGQEIKRERERPVINANTQLEGAINGLKEAIDAASKLVISLSGTKTEPIVDKENIVDEDNSNGGYTQKAYNDYHNKVRRIINGEIESDERVNRATSVSVHKLPVFADPLAQPKGEIIIEHNDSIEGKDILDMTPVLSKDIAIQDDGEVDVEKTFKNLGIVVVGR